MLDGITVLSQTVIEDANMALVLIPAFLVLVVAAVGCAAGDIDSLVGSIISVGLAFIAALIAYSIAKHPTDKYEYECVIDESETRTKVAARTAQTFQKI